MNIKYFLKTFFQEHLHRHFILWLPILWVTLFLLVPFLIILKISFAESVLALPPVCNVFEFLKEEQIRVTISYKNYLTIFTDPFYRQALSSSLILAFTSTFITLIVGYMMAYGMSKMPRDYHPILLMLIMIPFWTSFLVRVYAWMNMLNTKGLLNQFLLFLGLIQEPLQLLDHPATVCFGIMYCYLPFMVLPIYTALEKIDHAYSEAAFDLGASPWRVFWRVTVPLSYSGVISGCVLVFMPAIGEFVIPELLGGPDTFTIGRALWLEFFNNRNWPLACALGVLIIVPIIVCILLVNRFKKTEEGF
ncbi:MAG: Putrescine transport system permease protein PotH [Holosporales bacterium]